MAAQRLWLCGRWWRLVLLCWCLAGWHSAHASAAVCAPHIDSIMAVRADMASTTAPAQGWEPVRLPDNWARRWPTHDGVVWYRIQWQTDCPAPSPPVALTIDAINMAGAVYINQDLLWRDPHLSEPLSRSWSSSRYWVLPQSALQSDGHNTVWVRVTGVAALSPGLGVAQLGAPLAMLSAHRWREWNIRTSFLLNLTLVSTLGLMALVAWCSQRQHVLLGWYALVSLCWLLFGSNVLLTETWPFPDNHAMARANHMAYISYIASFAVLCWHLVDRPLSRRLLRCLGGATLAAWALIVASPGWFTMQRVADAYTLLFLGNALAVIWYAVRTRNPQYRLIAAGLALMVSMGLRDLLVLLEVWPSRHFYSSYTGLFFLLLSALLLHQRLLHNTRRIERFNQELRESVAQACDDLETTLAKKHTLALHNAQLQERLQLAQDLHDGLGGQIVRSIMLVEQSETPPSKARYLSMLKLLRDDLRQVVDSDGSIGANAPTTPEEWTIPLRYRFASLFDDLDMRSEWLAPLHWKAPPTALQCMLLARVAEEALTNIVKHSQARMVRVSLSYPDTQQLVLRIEDDGIGFDAPTALRAGLGIGMSSMRARMERMGGSLQVQSRPGCTVIEASLPQAHLGISDSAPAAAALPTASHVPTPAPTLVPAPAPMSQDASA